jgi:hypothetical protein
MSRSASSVIDQLAGLQPVRLDLLGHQVALGDLDLLVLGVARQRMISMRSSSGAGMFSVLAVQTNITSDRS